MIVPDEGEEEEQEDGVVEPDSTRLLALHSSPALKDATVYRKAVVGDDSDVSLIGRLWAMKESGVPLLLPYRVDADCLVGTTWVLVHGSSFDVRATSVGLPLLKSVTVPGVVGVRVATAVPTYVDKVLVGTEAGGLFLVNVATGDLLVSYACLRASVGETRAAAAESGVGAAVVSTKDHDEETADSAAKRRRGATGDAAAAHPTLGSITALAASPVTLDIVAVGTSTGFVFVINVATDKVIRVFRHERGGVASLAFRSDYRPVLASGGTDGTLATWDLRQGRLLHVDRFAHAEKITFLAFLFEEPLLLSVGRDNAIRLHTWDVAADRASDVSDTPRLLRERTGHAGPPTHIRFANLHAGGSVGAQRWMLTAGTDRAVRLTSLIRDEQSTDLSQGAGLRKMARKRGAVLEELRVPPVIDVDVSGAKEREWANVVSVHRDEAGARVWSTERATMGDLFLASTDDAVRSGARQLSACCLSTCGNYAFVGTESGVLDRFNMQSGAHRGTLVWSKALGRAHEEAIVGLTVDSAGRYLLSAGREGGIHVWDAAKLKPVRVISLDSPPTLLRPSPASTQLIAVASDDLCVRLLDVESGRSVRRFGPHRNVVRDISLSPDGLLLSTASADGLIRTWHVATATLVDAFRPSTPPVGLAHSASSEYLATIHAGDRAIKTWANGLHFGYRRIRAVAEPARATDSAAFDEQVVVAGGAVEEEEEPAVVPGTVSLGSAGLRGWQSLANIRSILARNRAPDLVEKPKHAPFLLPVAPGLDGDRFIVEDPEAVRDDPVAQMLPRVSAAESAAAVVSESESEGEWDAALPPGALDGSEEEEGGEAGGEGEEEEEESINERDRTGRLAASARIFSFGGLAACSEWCGRLRRWAVASEEATDADEAGALRATALAALAAMSAAAAANEVSLLRGPDRLALVRAIRDELQHPSGERSVGFEVCNAWLRLLLNDCSDELVVLPEDATDEDRANARLLVDELSLLEKEVSSTWSRLESTAQSVLCMVDVLGGINM
jgi:WD40 repeat protein